MLEWEIALLLRCSKDVREELDKKYGNNKFTCDVFINDFVGKFFDKYSKEFREMKSIKIEEVK